MSVFDLFIINIKYYINGCSIGYTQKNVRSVTAFNNTDIRSVQDNVAISVTAMMVTVCISTDIRPATELM